MLYVWKRPFILFGFEDIFSVWRILSLAFFLSIFQKRCSSIFQLALTTYLLSLSLFLCRYISLFFPLAVLDPFLKITDSMQFIVSSCFLCLGLLKFLNDEILVIAHLPFKYLCPSGTPNTCTFDLLKVVLWVTFS